MADSLYLGTLNLNSGNIQLLNDELYFREADRDVSYQDYLRGAGARVTDVKYKNSQLKMKLRVTGSNKQAILDNIHLIIAECEKDSNILAYKPYDATDFSYIKVYGKSSSTKTTTDWYFYKARMAIVELNLDCSPFWQSAVVAIPVNLLKDGRLNTDDDNDGIANSWSVIDLSDGYGYYYIDENAQKIEVL